MVLVLAKCGKISNVQAARSVGIAILKKVVTAVRKSYDSYHEKTVPAVKKSCLLWAEANEVKKVILDYWRGHFNIYFMDLAEKW